jgi:hypothetical protein
LGKPAVSIATGGKIFACVGSLYPTSRFYCNEDTFFLFSYFPSPSSSAVSFRYILRHCGSFAFFFFSSSSSSLFAACASLMIMLLAVDNHGYSLPLPFLPFSVADCLDDVDSICDCLKIISLSHSLCSEHKTNLKRLLSQARWFRKLSFFDCIYMSIGFALSFSRL